MATDAQKTQYLDALAACLTQLAELSERAAALAQIFADRGYDRAAADPITVAQLGPYGVASATADPAEAVYYLGNAVNVCQALVALCAGSQVAANPAAHAALSRWRHV